MLQKTPDTRRTTEALDALGKAGDVRMDMLDHVCLRNTPTYIPFGLHQVWNVA